MYDAVTPKNIPGAPDGLVACYVDGYFRNEDEVGGRFPHAKLVRIAVSRESKANVLDVEKGDATADDAVVWATTTMMGTPIDNLTIYCDESNWESVRLAFGDKGLRQPNYWIALYDNSRELLTGAVAKQFSSNAYYDTSIVCDHWPGVDA
ncbi:hypothetical protein ACN6AT_35570 (plasmid) [Streptomyces sp. JL4002]|uniref:hypothetical protein n=1 Tax=Streptomyces sp. JL4002 TaxID=3404781 RepID=UPI003B27EBE7